MFKLTKSINLVPPSAFIFIFISFYFFLFISFYLFLFIIFWILFIPFWLCWIFPTVQAFLNLQLAGTPLCCSAPASPRGGFSSCGAQALGFPGFSTCSMRFSVVAGPRVYGAGSVVMAHKLSCSSACGIFLAQESNPCLLHWQADS